MFRVSCGGDCTLGLLWSYSIDCGLILILYCTFLSSRSSVYIIATPTRKSVQEGGDDKGAKGEEVEMCWGNLPDKPMRHVPLTQMVAAICSRPCLKHQHYIPWHEVGRFPISRNHNSLFGCHHLIKTPAKDDFMSLTHVTSAWQNDDFHHKYRLHAFWSKWD